MTHLEKGSLYSYLSSNFCQMQQTLKRSNMRRLEMGDMGTLFTSWKQQKAFPPNTADRLWELRKITWEQDRHVKKHTEANSAWGIAMMPGKHKNRAFFCSDLFKNKHYHNSCSPPSRNVKWVSLWNARNQPKLCDQTCCSAQRQRLSQDSRASSADSFAKLYFETFVQQVS